MESQEQFRQFRSSVEGHVTSMKRFRPDVVKDDWASCCPSPLDEFLRQFPTDQARSKLLDVLVTSVEETRAAIASVQDDLFGGAPPAF